MITAALEKYLFPKQFRISLTYAAFILFGIMLGAIKGAFLGMLCDTLKMTIFGIGNWMIEYAIIPPMIAILSALLMRLINLKGKNIWTSGFIFLVIATIFLVVFLLKKYNVISWNENKAKLKKTDLVPVYIVSIISGIGISGIWIFALSLFIIYAKNMSFKSKWRAQLLFVILVSIFIILVICRWFWGPFAYITYHNRFHIKGGTKWKYGGYFAIFMTPIIFKTLIEIPIYTTIIYFLYPLTMSIKRKIKQYINNGFGK